MTTASDNSSLYRCDSYRLDSLDDEIRVDQLCGELLQAFARQLREEQQLEPLTAGSHAAGADYFLRNYLIDACRLNICAAEAKHVRGFAGNWYILNNLEPNLAELGAFLDGVEAFYQFCAAQQMIEPARARQIAAACAEREFYQQRIDSFHQLTDGYANWNHQCPVS